MPGALSWRAFRRATPRDTWPHYIVTPIPVLLIDGTSNHDWQRGTRILREFLAGSGLFSVDVSTTPPLAAPQTAWDVWQPNFSGYRVVISNYNNMDGAESGYWPSRVQTAFEAYVRGGGGLVCFHSANNAFTDWTEYNEMIGLGWRPKEFGPSLVVDAEGRVARIPAGEGRGPGHPEDHDFVIHVLEPNHPITAGLPAAWLHPHDQLTHGQHGPAENLTVLTWAHSASIDENEPMDWAVSYGEGRVYTTMQGHLWAGGSDIALRCLGFQTLFIRGVEWAATGAVTHPCPAEFPSTFEVKLATDETN